MLRQLGEARPESNDKPFSELASLCCQITPRNLTKSQREEGVLYEAMSNISNKDYRNLTSWTFSLSRSSHGHSQIPPLRFMLYATETVPSIGEVYQPLLIRTLRNYCSEKLFALIGNALSFLFVKRAL